MIIIKINEEMRKENEGTTNNRAIHFKGLSLPCLEQYSMEMVLTSNLPGSDMVLSGNLSTRYLRKGIDPRRAKAVISGDNLRLQPL